MTDEPSDPLLDEVRDTTAEMAAVRARRDAAIVTAARHGRLQIDIAAAAQLSRMWVRRIVRAADEREHGSAPAADAARPSVDGG